MCAAACFNGSMPTQERWAVNGLPWSTPGTLPEHSSHRTGTPVPCWADSGWQGTEKGILNEYSDRLTSKLCTAKYIDMSDHWASENLQTIRTLMERAAVYRRALAPVMSATGVIGIGAALAGWKTDIAAPGPFILYWLGVAVVTLAAGGLLIRRQALQQAEPFWSPPTRRVFQAMMPPLIAGLTIGIIMWVGALEGGDTLSPGYYSNVCLPLIWVILYGCAVHAAGFFMKRGIRLFGWLIILCGCAGFMLGQPETDPGFVDLGYAIMGTVFGLLHLVYGLYLFATERSSAAE